MTVIITECLQPSRSRACGSRSSAPITPTTLRFAQGGLSTHPEISDAEYDRLFRELQALEAAHPELQSPDSPTLRVGAVTAGALAKHTHRRPMLSLANAFSDEELAAWEEQNPRLVPEVRRAGYTIETKIAGAA